MNVVNNTPELINDVKDYQLRREKLCINSLEEKMMNKKLALYLQQYSMYSETNIKNIMAFIYY